MRNLVPLNTSTKVRNLETNDFLGDCFAIVGMLNYAKILKYEVFHLEKKQATDPIFDRFKKSSKLSKNKLVSLGKKLVGRKMNITSFRRIRRINYYRSYSNQNGAITYCGDVPFEFDMIIWKISDYLKKYKSVLIKLGEGDIIKSLQSRIASIDLSIYEKDRYHLLCPIYYYFLDTSRYSKSFKHIPKRICNNLNRRI